MDVLNAKINYSPVGGYTDLSSTSLYAPVIVQYHIENKCPLSYDHFKGIIKNNLQEIVDFLLEKGGKLGLTSDSTKTFLYDNSYITLYTSKKTNKSSNDITIDLLSANPETDIIYKHILDNFVSESTKDLIFAIIKTDHGFETRSLGYATMPLIENNYTKSVLEDLSYSLKAFEHEPPIGRILILNGVPGTGKTSLIRSILSKMDNVFLLVPSNIVSSLDQPEMIPFLLDLKSKYNKPVTFIIEDGDTCIVPRGLDNISSVAALLNLSDGILGSLIDIRMIISSNAEIDNMDEAIMRPGRLVRNINISSLSYDHANEVYQRLMQNDSAHLPESRNYTLAEIYAIFNNKDIVNSSVTPIKKRIGFGK